jgi:hypothetical protein
MALKRTGVGLTEKGKANVVNRLKEDNKGEELAEEYGVER